MIGNEVVDVSNSTLEREGPGTAGDPYTLGLNLGNPNTWTATQTFGATANPSIAGASNADLKLFSSGTGGTLWGTMTTVGSLTACTSNGTTTIAKASHGLTLLAGDTVRVTSATTAADVGFYRLVSSTAGTLVVSRALAGSDADVALTVYRTGMALGPNGRLYNTSTLTGSSGTMFGTVYSPQVNQSGTAGYTALYVDATQTATGSGTKRLLALAADGASMFSVSNAGAVTGVDSTWNKPNITTTLTSAVSLANVTPATAGTTVQQSPALRFEGHAREATGGTDDKLEWYNFMLPVTGLAASSRLYWQHSKEGAAVSTPMYLTSAGALTVLDSINSPTYASGYTLDATAQVGMIVCIDEAHATCTGDCVSPCASGSAKPVGVYTGTTAGTAHASTLYNIAESGKAYTIPEEDHADVALGDVVVTATGVAGYAEYSAAVPAEYNQEVGHAIRASAKVTFDGNADVNTGTETITLDSDPTTWAVDDPVVYWNSADTEPTGLTDGSVYWIKTKSGAAVTLSASKGGAMVNITAAGSGTTMYLQKLVWTTLH